MENKTISLLGCGWLGVALAPSLMERGFEVRGSTTTPSKLSLLTSLGIEAHLLRIEPTSDQDSHSHTERADRFFDSDVLLVNIPPEAALGPDYHLGQLREILSLQKFGEKLRHVIYVSSTSVYGSDQGEVDERTSPRPDPGSGEILVQAENLLSNAAAQKSFALTIVRSAGQIGPGRHPGLFLAGRKNVRDGEGAVNMIHQFDLVQVLAGVAAHESPAAGETRVFNAVASAHPSRKEFYTTAANQVGVEPPTFEGDTKKSAKIVHGEEIKKMTGTKFRYDDLYSSFGAKKRGTSS